MSEKEQFSAEEIEKLGYDPEVVAYFKENDSALLTFMWGNGSALYVDILSNTITDEKLQEAYERALTQSSYGKVLKVTTLLKNFRNPLFKKKS